MRYLSKNSQELHRSKQLASIGGVPVSSLINNDSLVTSKSPLEKLVDRKMDIFHFQLSSYFQ